MGETSVVFGRKTILVYFGNGLWHSAEGQRRQNDFHNLANSMQNPLVNPVGSDERTKLLS